MNGQPRLSAAVVWSQHERLCTGLLRQALESLADNFPNENEDDLNRDLYRAIIRYSHKAAQDGRYIPPVVPEGRNPPASTDQERARREFKRPDFYWAYIDPLVDNPDEASKQFVVECKRLTTPSTHYMREYVVSGIARFIDVGHGYGMGMKSGAVIGYLQKVTLDDALCRVNAEALQVSIPVLVQRVRREEAGAEFDQLVLRAFPESPFHLIHIWGRIGPAPTP